MKVKRKILLGASNDGSSCFGTALFVVSVMTSPGRSCNRPLLPKLCIDCTLNQSNGFYDKTAFFSAHNAFSVLTWQLHLRLPKLS